MIVLPSANPVASVPASITIPTNSTTGTFTVATTQVTKAKTVTITATANGVGKTAKLKVKP